jgi:hypothetical protein
MYRGYVFAIGDKPDNGSWTGFQNVNSEGSGYLTVFRELNNKHAKKKIQLRFLSAGTKLKIRDILTGAEREMRLDEDCKVEFSISDSAGFLFLRYEVLEKD